MCDAAFRWLFLALLAALGALCVAWTAFGGETEEDEGETFEDLPDDEQQYLRRFFK